MIKETFFKKYDVLLIQKFNPLTILPIVIAKLKCKYVIVDWDDWDTGLQKNMILRFATWICEKIGPYFPSLITSHNPNLLALVPSKKHKLLLTQGFDEELFRSNVNFEKTLSISGANEKQISVGYMCTFTTGGTLDLDDLLVTLSKVNRPSMKFIIIGGGELLEAYKKRAENLKISNIAFTGHVSHEKIPAFLSTLHIGLIYMKPSTANQHRLSFKVIEYLATNVPVVGETIGETNRLFSQWIHHVPLAELPKYLEEMDSNALPSTKSSVHLLKSYTWSKIIRVLHTHLETIKDS